ncbi:MAG: superoxide dismutase family protein [Polyangiaceae bacterium]|nr:superoxide dismutase family protein [Polyangiaceae bacterium]
MKTIFGLLGIAAAMMMVACGDDSTSGGGGSGGEGGSTATQSGGGGTDEGGAPGTGGEGGTPTSDGGAGGGTGGEGGSAEGISASASISGDGITGTATFTMIGTEVTFTIDVDGVMPTGNHAVHIHENPDCSGDLSAAGGHWNPNNAAQHGVFDQGGHLGDIGDIPVNDDGTGTYTVSTDLWSVGPAGTDVMKNVVGHSIIVHEMSNADPGMRMACGIIELD